MSGYRVAIVDDEPLARGIVRGLLDRDPEVRLVGEASDGASGLALLRRRCPDVAFLDVEMPEVGGVELAAALEPEERPVIVFVTAYSHFATGAFGVEALDYIVKPFSDRRFFEALARAKARVQEHRMSELARRVVTEVAESDLAALEDAGEETGVEALQAIPVRCDGRTLLVRPQEVIWIESQDYYARIHTDRGGHLVRTSLASFEARLDGRRFLRVHRGAIVNADRVVEVQRLANGARALVLSDGTRCRVSRARRAEVERRLLPRIG